LRPERLDERLNVGLGHPRTLAFRSLKYGTKTPSRLRCCVEEFQASSALYTDAQALAHHPAGLASVEKRA
jgi:hypothetical protein